MRKRTLIGIAILSFAVAARTPFAAQTAQVFAPLRFDVGSVKERDPKVPLGLVGFQRSPGRLVNRCATLTSLVFYAYSRTRSTPIDGLPGWADTPCSEVNGTDTYEVHATMPPETSDAQARQMMQTLLAERFRFAAHMERRTLPIYRLVIAPGGFKLTPSDPNSDRAPTSRTFACPVADQSCHLMAMGVSSISQLAGALGGSVGRPVIDQTGLSGTYEMVLYWAGDSSVNSPLPSLPTALRERFGLELKANTGPVDVLVIDHVERPSPN